MPSTGTPGGCPESAVADSRCGRGRGRHRRRAAGRTTARGETCCTIDHDDDAVCANSTERYGGSGACAVPCGARVAVV